MKTQMRHCTGLMVAAFLLVISLAKGQEVRLPVGVNVLNNGFFDAEDDVLKGWRPRDGGLGTFQVVKPQEDDASPVLTISVQKTSARPWTMELWQSVDKPVEKGCTMFISFEFKMSRGYSFQFYWQQETDPWPKLLSLRLTEPTEQWEVVRLAVPVHTTYKPGETAFSFHLAEKSGVLQLRRMSAILVPPEVNPETLPITRSAVLGGDFYDRDWRAKVTERMKRIRTVPVTVTVTKGKNKAKDATVKLQQTSRPFKIGVECTGALMKPGILKAKGLQQLSRRLVEVQEKLPQYSGLVLNNELFDMVTFTDAMIWREHELWGRQIDEELVDMAQKAGLKVKGHALFCPAYMFAPQNCRNMGREALKAAILGHIRQMCERFKGKLDYWEVVHGGVDYNEIYKVVGVECLPLSFQTAREAEPTAKLLLSDIQALSAISDAPLLDTVELADWLVNNCGVKIDGIVLGANMQRLDVGPQSMEKRLDKVSAQLPGVPIHISGLAVNSDKEDLQAEMLSDYMLLFYSHPAVESVSLGELWEPVLTSKLMGYFHDDLTPHASFETIRNLLKKEWLTSKEGATDAEGVFSAPGYVGDYDLTVVEGDRDMHVSFSLPSLVGRQKAPVVEKKENVVIEHTEKGTSIQVSFP